MLTSKAQASAQVTAGGGTTKYYIAVNARTSPYIRVYPWTSASGFGTVYASPSTLPADGTACCFSPSGDVIYIGATVDAYQWSDAGFGTKYAATSVAVILGQTTTSTGTQVVACASNSNIRRWPWSSATGFGTMQTVNISPSNVGNEIAISPADDAVAVAGQISPYVHAFAFSASGYGSKFSNPGTLPGGNCYGVHFHPAGDAVAFASTTTPFVIVYPWSAAGFGTKFADPAVVPTSSTENSVQFSPSGNVLLCSGSSTSPRIHAYAWSVSGFGTKYANPSTALPSGQTNCVTFSSDGTAVFITASTSPFVHAYAWSDASGFGAKYSNPAVLPTAEPKAIAFGKIVT